MFFIYFFFVVGVIATLGFATPSVIRGICFLIAEFKTIAVTYKTELELKNGRIALRKELAATQNAGKIANAVVDAMSNNAETTTTTKTENKD